MSTAFLWLRRDLRLHDHAVLSHALERARTVQPVFIFDTDILARFTNAEDRRLTFIAEALQQIDGALKKRGGGLLVFHGRAQEIIPKLAGLFNAQIFASEDYEPLARARDAAVAKTAPLSLVKEQVIFSPTQVLKGDGTPYKVFTPYSHAWLSALSPASSAPYEYNDKGRYADHVSLQDKARQAGLRVIDASDAAAMLKAMGYRHVALPLWPVSDAKARLATFCEEKIHRYDKGRDFMADEGTSRLSPYLRFGLVSVRECLRAAQESRNPRIWTKELIWREFYAMILYHYPESVDHEWNPAYRGLAWSQGAGLLDTWKQGRTGFPVVDAAMRQLLTEGWMHNRARMIVASFLTKDLHIDWRLGEEHFAQYLMDYEQASNVGGWQWAASTGTDAQPWFRIFNPLLQSRKFDPEGAYIRRYVPELAGLDAKEIHAPPPLIARACGYPQPCVDHANAREKALAMFKKSF